MAQCTSKQLGECGKFSEFLKIVFIASTKNYPDHIKQRV